MTKSCRLLVGALACAVLCALLIGSVHPASPDRPSLVVLVIVDQLGGGMLEEIGGEFKGGFRRFLDQGRRFTQCRHAHALTETGPGYATLLSGLYPAHSGVILNEWHDRLTGKDIYCVGAGEGTAPNFDGSTAVSAANLLGENLSDLIKRSDPASQVYTVAGKDRASVLTAGHHPDGAFWFSLKTGGFTSNPGILFGLPPWGDDFWGAEPTAGRLYREGLPEFWTYPIRPRARPDDDPFEDARNSRVAPHPVTVQDPAKRKPEDRIGAMAYNMWFTPWLDWLTLQLAGRILEEKHLGADDSPDLLVVALTATDTIGHRYGPGSQEHLDHLLRLDAWLGGFLDKVETSVSRSGRTVLFALSADHGVLPLPERLAGARRVDEKSFQLRLEAGLAKRLGEGRFIESNIGGHLYFDRALLERRGVKLTRAIEETRRVLAGFPEVARTYTPADFESAPGGDLFLDLYRNSYSADRGGDLVLQPCEKCLFTSSPTGTSHGSPYDYDRLVPMIFLGAAIPPGEDAGECRTVDLAPTLAETLHLPPFAAPRDGRPLALRSVDTAPALK